MKRTAIGMMAALIAATMLAGCAGMTAREKSTAIGAGVGGLAGNVISGGSTFGTAAGAAAGAAVGYESAKRRGK